jgi:hypothetical protein
LAFILGLEPRITGSAFLSTQAIYDLVGHNVGNLAFHHAVHRQIGPLRSLPWNVEPEEASAAGSIGVVPAANQVGAHADFGNLAKRFEALDINLVAIGLGAQSNDIGNIPQVPDGTLSWIRRIVERSASHHPNISVRGCFTQKVLDHYGFEGKTVVLGCPSLFINTDPQLGKKIEVRFTAPKRIAVAAGHPNWGSLRELERSLARLLTKTGGSYVGQAPLEMVKLTRGEAAELNPDVLRLLRDYILPEYELGEFINWANTYGNVFFDVDSWMEHYRSFDLVIGARIHGTILALQAGVPGVCIAHDSRTEELCRTMLIPFVKAGDYPHGMSRSELARVFVFDGAAFDANRKILAKRYLEFLENNNLSPSAEMKALARSNARETRS